MTREQIIEAAAAVHDEQGCGCDRRYLMSCPRMAAAILGAGRPSVLLVNRTDGTGDPAATVELAASLE